MEEQLIFNYRSDSRVREHHFILSDINSLFLQKWGITSTVKAFREQVQKHSYAFKVKTGNLAKGIKYTKVYDIYNFIPKKTATKEISTLEYTLAQLQDMVRMPFKSKYEQKLYEIVVMLAKNDIEGAK